MDKTKVVLEEGKKDIQKVIHLSDIHIKKGPQKADLHFIRINLND